MGTINLKKNVLLNYKFKILNINYFTVYSGELKNIDL